MNIVIVGGVAGGMSCAARARRLSEDATITVLDKGPYVSFANCGLPYFLAGEIEERDDLLLHTPDSLARIFNIDTRPRHEVTAIDPDGKTVTVHNMANDTTYQLPYDTLVLSPGADAIVPPMPGADLPRVQTLRSIPDMDAIEHILREQPHSAVVVGAGFIGLEVAEALRHRGLAVTVVELAPQVLPPLDPEMAASVEAALRDHGVTVRTGISVTGITESDPHQPMQVSLSNQSQLEADLVVMAIGVKPNTALATSAGIATTDRGAIIVDEAMRTNVPGIYAIGDAVEVTDAVTGAGAVIPLAGPANRQGRAAANRIFGHPASAASRSQVQATAIVRVFDTVAASTGRSEKSLRASGIPCQAVHVHPNSHAGYYPGATPVHLKVLFGEDGAILGAQAVGQEGVDKRIDVIATAIRGGLKVADLAELELCYSPPFGSAKDPVNIAGMVADNIRSGVLELWYPQDYSAGSSETSQTPDTLSPETVPEQIDLPKTDSEQTDPPEIDSSKTVPAQTNPTQPGTAAGVPVTEPSAVAGIPAAESDAPATAAAATNPDPVLLDVRTRREYRGGHLPGALNIPHTELRERLDEVPAGRPVRVYCAAGFRSYLASRILKQHGWSQVSSLSGGMQTFTPARPDVSLEF